MSLDHFLGHKPNTTIPDFRRLPQKRCIIIKVQIRFLIEYSEGRTSKACRTAKK
jgi:hypothetical protein